MQRIRRKDTAPELRVRRFLHAAGLRFRLHVATLPATPDIVLPRFRTVILVHGCFWHGHRCPHGSVPAKTNASFWSEKILANRKRDRRKANQLRKARWYVETMWECQTESITALTRLCERIRSRDTR